MEDESDKRDAMDWLVDDEILRQWEEGSKEEEKITVKRHEGRQSTVERVQSEPELVVAQAQMTGREATAEKQKKQEARWSTKNAGRSCGQKETLRTLKKWCSGEHQPGGWRRRRRSWRSTKSKKPR